MAVIKVEALIPKFKTSVATGSYIILQPALFPARPLAAIPSSLAVETGEAKRIQKSIVNIPLAKSKSVEFATDR